MMSMQHEDPGTMVKNTPHLTDAGQAPYEVKLKIEELKRSVSEVYKYELLTTNQYLKQMELVLEIFNELTELMKTGQGSHKTIHQ